MLGRVPKITAVKFIMDSSWVLSVNNQKKRELYIKKAYIE
jgi:hypothetical protein